MAGQSRAFQHDGLSAEIENDAMKLLAIAAWLLALQGQGEPRQPTFTPPSAPPPMPPRMPQPPSQNLPAPSEHMIDRFVAGLPRTVWPGLGPSELDRGQLEELKTLSALNPGKEGRVAAILRAADACTDAARAGRGERVLRSSARRMGVEKLGRLIDLFAGPDFARIETLTDRIAEGAPPAAADRAELERLFAAYPLAEFGMEVVQGMHYADTDEVYLAALRKCRGEESAAFAKAGIRAR